MARTPMILPLPNIISALRDPQSFGGLSCFKDLSSWARWLVFLKALYGLPMNAEELSCFRYHTGRTAPLPGGYPVAVVIVGRQSGKTRIASTVTAYEALRAQRVPDGESEYALLTGQDERGSLRTLFSYALAPFSRPALKGALASKPKRDHFRLSNGVTVAAYPCRPEALRGPRAISAVCDELAYFISSDGHPTDSEMLRAVRYTLQNTRGRLLILSSPAAQYGALWKLYSDWWANEKATTLIWKGTAPEMNPTIDAEVLARQQLEDPEGYRSEVLAEFRSGQSALLDGAALDVLILTGRRETPPLSNRTYVGFFDATGGRSDPMTAAVAHVEDEDYAVLDAVRGWSGSSPRQDFAEACAFYKSFGIDTVYGDNFGMELVTEHFKENDLTYVKSPMDKSKLYLELLTLVNTGQCRLLDHPPLLRELRALERRPGNTGHDRVGHPRGAHDDYANSAAGALVIAALLSKFPPAQANTWHPGELAAVRRAFPGLGLHPEPYGGWQNYVEDDTGQDYADRDMRWTRNGRPLW